MKPRLSLEQGTRWIESARTYQAATMRFRSVKLRLDHLDPVAAFTLHTTYRLTIQGINRRRIRLATDIKENCDA
jgi:hypothetical protein